MNKVGRTSIAHLVLLSGRGEAGAERAEAVLEASGLNWNIVRAIWFMQNFSEGFMIEGILIGELMLPASEFKEPFVDVDDIADVAVAALTRPELRNRLFEVSGPRAMTLNSINDVILRTWFTPLFFGTILRYLLLAVLALFDWNNPNAPLLLTAGLTYFVGMFLCTVLINVPLNNRLAKAEESGIDKLQLCSHYYQYWTRWNHLRTVNSWWPAF